MLVEDTFLQVAAADIAVSMPAVDAASRAADLLLAAALAAADAAVLAAVDTAVLAAVDTAVLAAVDTAALEAAVDAAAVTGRFCRSIQKARLLRQAGFLLG